MTLHHTGNASKLTVDGVFYSSDFGTVVGNNEILRSVHIPFSKEVRRVLFIDVLL